MPRCSCRDRRAIPVASRTLLPLAMAVSFMGCDGTKQPSPSPAPPSGSTGTGEAEAGGAPSSEAGDNVDLDTYEVRARIVQLPEPGDPTSALQAHHEPIPDFRAPDGSTGMDAMVMPFPIKPGLSIEGLKVGDIVALTFDVMIRREPSERDPSVEIVSVDYHITKFEHLPPDTVLNLGMAQPAPGEQPAQP